MDEPKTAWEERSLRALEMIAAAVAVDERPLGELPFDPMDRGPDPGIVEGEESDHRDPEVGRVDPRTAVRLPERSVVGVDPAGEDLPPDLIGRSAPSRGPRFIVAEAAEGRGPIEPHPGHHLGVDIVVGRPPDFPEA